MHPLTVTHHMMSEWFLYIYIYICIYVCMYVCMYVYIYKAFDRVWHDALIYKIQCCAIKAKLMKLIQSFLRNKYLRVILNSQTSTWIKGWCTLVSLVLQIGTISVSYIYKWCNKIPFCQQQNYVLIITQFLQL